MPEPKRDIKDSVFTFLFSDIEYTKQLYLSLHPEDTDIRDEDFRLVTLENILAIGQYNDLGFQVRDKLILLVEAQSTFSPNIPLYDGSGSADLTVRVLRDGQPGDILSQYVDFCQVANEQVSLYGRTDEALMSTIQLCLEQGILVPFLDSRKKEVVDIMTRLFSQEKAWEMELAANARENREAGRVEGRVEGRMEAQADMLRRLLQKFSILEVSQIMGIPQSEIERLTRN